MIKEKDQLGQVIQKIIFEQESLDESFQEMKMFYAPTECRKPIIDSWLQRTREIVEESGWDPLELSRAIKERISPKWVNQRLNYFWEDAFPEVNFDKEDQSGKEE